MSFDNVYAAVAVPGLEAAADFYARLLGRPADARPMPSLAQWDLGPSGGLQVVELPGPSAGTGMVTLLLSDFDATLAELAGRGVELGEVVTGTLSRLTVVHDPAGNTVTLAEIPAG